MVRTLPAMLRHRTVAALIAAAVVTPLAAPGARADVFTVTTTADTSSGGCTEADCSLREAVVAANAVPAADTIVIPAGTYTLGGTGGEDLATTGDLDLRGSVTITGAGAGVTTIDGGGVDRIFDIVTSATVTISGVTLTHGHVPAGDTQGGGAILWNEPGTGAVLDLRLDGVVVTGNHAGAAGDGGGGIRIAQDKPASSVVTIANSTISDNTMQNGDGGGLHLCCENLTVTITDSTIAGNDAVEDAALPGLNGEGGGIYHCCTDTSLTVADTTISDNDGPTQGGGIYTCCGVASNTLLTVERTTVSGNRALGPGMSQGNGGGIEGEGAVVLVNTTLSGNHARKDGGGIDNEDVLVMRNVTIAGNDGGRGGGFYEDGLMTTLANVLFAGNVEMPSTASANCAVAVGTEPLVSEGGNLSSDATCPLAGTGDQASSDPLLLPLGDNGGATPTHALPSNSPAVDGGSDAGCQPLDQRGFPRPGDGDHDGAAHCDVGAFELGSAVENCMNGVDDNGNGLVDCFDFDCAGQPLCAERCDNCIDDDGDGLVDRDDTGDCAARADGAGAGVADPARGKVVAKCALTLRKAGAKMVGARLKALQGCVARLSTCVQVKGGDAGCLAKAGQGCANGVAKLGATAAKLRAAVGKSCEPLASDELFAASGIGAGAEAARCDDLGVPNLGTADAVGACVLASHACTADRLVAVETPRAPELLGLGGLDAAVFLPCAPATGAALGGGLGERGKALDACQRAIQKSDAKLVAGTAALLRKCATQVFACRQQKASDPACLVKAQASCPKLRAKITGLTTKVAEAVAKKCDTPKLAIAEILGASGAGLQSQAALCKALAVPSLGSIAAVSDCLARHEQCRAHQLVEREIPRLDELLATGGIVFP